MIPVEATLIVQYDTSEEQIAKLGEECKGIAFNTPENYEIGRVALGKLRGLRTAVEKRRKEIKADILERGRNIDAVAKHFTDLIEAIELPLVAAKRAVDDEAERAKREQERAEIIALEAKLKAEREEAEAKAKAEREAEEARLAAERERLAAERAQQEEANRAAAEAQRIEQANIEAQRAELRKQQEVIDAANREAARIENELRQREKAEQDRLAAEEAAKAEAARLDALRPEVDRVHAFAADIRVLIDRGPAVESIECRRALDWATAKLRAVADGLYAFKGKIGP
jgi:chromosome segregation ATPase